MKQDEDSRACPYRGARYPTWMLIPVSRHKRSQVTCRECGKQAEVSGWTVAMFALATFCSACVGGLLLREVEAGCRRDVWLLVIASVSLLAGAVVGRLSLSVRFPADR